MQNLYFRKGVFFNVVCYTLMLSEPNIKSATKSTYFSVLSGPNIKLTRGKQFLPCANHCCSFVLSIMGVTLVYVLKK